LSGEISIKSGEILKIKTKAPPLGADVLSRPRMQERMEANLSSSQGFTRQLTLISTPAGFGKTTLVRKWLEGREDRIAWFSVDQGDNEPERFWLYLITALQAIEEEVGNGPLQVLGSRGVFTEASSTTASFLTPLLNDLFELKEPLFLVLDDYHLINTPLIHEGMIYFIENLPPLVHLTVTTRSDPPWPLSRWRARGKMLDVRLEELKFTREETNLLLTQSRGMQLNNAQLQTLYDKTEGWVTGLQLAAFSLSSGSDADEFINSFAGSHRHVFHFLSEEVFNRQSEEVREFLQKTSILERFNADLGNALTGREDSEEILTALDRNNLFVLPLDERGVWYRYHHLFADLLLHQLKRTYPEKVAELHQKAGCWFLAAGEPGEAVRHALAGGSPQNAARILHRHYEDIIQAEGNWQVARCLESFSPELLKKYPRLAINQALYYLIHKGREEGGACIEMAEELGYQDRKDQKEFAGMLSAVKAYYYIYANDFLQALESAEKALQMLPYHNYYWRMNVAIYSGDARLFTANPKGALPYYREAHRNSQNFGNPYLSLTTGFKVATCLYYLGRLQEAESFARDLLGMARDEGFVRVPRAGLHWSLLGDLLRERGDLEEAERCIERGIFISSPEKPSLGWNILFKAALYFSLCAYNEVLQMVEEIKMLHREFKLPQFIIFPAVVWEARSLHKVGEHKRAKEVLREAGITGGAKAERMEGQEKGYLALCRLLLEESRQNAGCVRELLNRVEEHATRGEYRPLLLETLLVKGRLEEISGNPEAAENCLVSALKAGMKEKYLQIFRDEGGELASVISRVLERWEVGSSCGVTEEVLAYLQAIFPEISRERSSTPRQKSRGDRSSTIDAQEQQNRQKIMDVRGTGDLVEELNPREREILQLICQGLSNRDISKKLYLSINTVKWYNSNIFGKLGAKNRTQATALARELNLI